MTQSDRSREKQRLRDRMLALRLAFAAKQQASARIAEMVLSLPEVQSAATVMCYVTMGSEVSTEGIVERLQSADRRLLVPVMSEGESPGAATLELGELRDSTSAIVGLTDFDCASIDVVLVPGIAFDRGGGRLGRGRGHYDRFLAALPRRSFLVGLAFDCQLTDSVPMEPHDVFLDAAVTESAVHRRPRPPEK
jgi:5-formyltetrahydrofolate cyclo-ligase